MLLRKRSSNNHTRTVFFKLYLTHLRGLYLPDIESRLKTFNTWFDDDVGNDDDEDEDEDEEDALLLQTNRHLFVLDPPLCFM